jgi:hypothetical protein
MTARKRGIIDLHLKTLAVSLVVLMVIPFAQAQEQQAAIQLRHQPTETHKIPSAGMMMPIAVQLENSSDVDIQIRLVGSRDGRFMDIAFPMGVLNTSDKPTYTIQIPAPAKAMTYQFIVHQKGGDLTLTDKFIVKRNCVQTFSVDVPEGTPSSEFRKEIAGLVAKARELERDTQNLETAIKLIDNLKKDIPG